MTTARWKLTPKQRVLERFPCCYARTYQSGPFDPFDRCAVIINGARNTHKSGMFRREREAWADAARRLK